MTIESDATSSQRADDPSAEGRLSLFHAGDRRLFASLYDEHYDAVDRAVGRILSGADRETVVHEVFYRLLSSETMRRSFQGGSFNAWIVTVARHQALDFVRRNRRETSLTAADAAPDLREHQRPGERAEAQLLVERFVREILPAKWASVFRTRFLEGLSQREAAQALGLHRTTLVYRELRIQRLLSRFLLGKEQP